MDLSKKIQLPLQNAEATYYPSLFTPEEAIDFFNILKRETDWQQDSITLFGKTHKQPRLTALYGEEGKTYTYSGITMFPKPFPEILKIIKSKVETISGNKFNAVLLNLYQDGNDSMGWHSDDEKELGENPVIASVSFGAERMFHLRHKTQEELRYKMKLENGSLLLMSGVMQHHWQHSLPKSKKIMAPRINLTFRFLK